MANCFNIKIYLKELLHHILQANKNTVQTHRHDRVVTLKLGSMFDAPAGTIKHDCLSHNFLGSLGTH